MSWPGGMTTTLFPVFQCAFADAEQQREFFLGDAQTFPHGFYLWIGKLESSGSFTLLRNNPVHFLNTAEQFCEVFLVHCYHRSTIVLSWRS